MTSHNKPNLTKFYNNDWDKLEIGIDEAGRGPLFGRVYTAAVVLPKDDTFKYELLKDSKKFSSKKKINEVADYIKENSINWSVSYKDETEIDNINIRQSVLFSMHDSIKKIIHGTEHDYFLLVDGNDFKPYMVYKDDTFTQINHICITEGDNKYCAIAAASILAKTERDKYIEKLCEENLDLKNNYGIHKNKGYGTKEHLMGIANYGISKWHRKTYGICKNF
jgi:ribonuclease HII